MYRAPSLLVTVLSAVHGQTLGPSEFPSGTHNDAATSRDGRCCPVPTPPLPDYPPLPSWSVHIPQLCACVLQTAVKQSRLEYVTACITAQGHARSLLPLRSEFKEIINRFEFRVESSWGGARVEKGGNFTPEYSHVLLFMFHTQIIKCLLTHFPPGFRSEVFFTLNPIISRIVFQMLAMRYLSGYFYIWIQSIAARCGRQHMSL